MTQPDLRGLDVGKHRLPCPECDKGPRDSALSVELRGDGSSVWWCWRCHFHGGTRGNRVLTVHAGSRPQPTPNAAERQRSRLAACTAIWKQVQPIAGTLGAEYLRLRHCALPPADGDLRFHAALYCPEISAEMPALVARVTTVIDNKFVGVHRIWIRRGETKAVKKMRLGASAEPVCIRLWPDSAVKATLGIAEGVETSLAAAQKFVPMWSCLDAGQLERFPLVPRIQSLTVWADYDEVGMKAATAVHDRYTCARRNAIVWRPKYVGEDACDAIAREMA